MNKMLIALTATFLALTSFYGSDAQAGCGGGYFRTYFHHRHHHHRHVYQSVRRHVRRHKVEVAKAPAKPVTVAKVEETPETTSETAVMENSSIATTPGTVAEATTPAPENKVVAAKDLGCKQFFPSVGMTLSVSCN
jgi:hypothetical protein